MKGGICELPHRAFNLNQPKNLQGALADLSELVLQAATNACLL
jgi:hypothetical protein